MSEILYKCAECGDLHSSAIHIEERGYLCRACYDKYRKAKLNRFNDFQNLLLEAIGDFTKDTKNSCSSIEHTRILRG